MELKYDLGILLGDYLDKIKGTILLSKSYLDTEFYKNNHKVLAKILFLAWQKGLAKQELFDLLNYIPTNEAVLNLVYDYKGVCSRKIIIEAVSVIWKITSIETLENEIKIEIQPPTASEQTIVHSERDENGGIIPLVYNGDPLSSLLLGNQTTALIISFIKLFLPVGVYLNISYAPALRNKKSTNTKKTKKVKNG